MDDDHELALVTPAMIEAGLYALSDLPFRVDYRDMVTAVYLAMEYERRDQVKTSGPPAPWYRLPNGNFGWGDTSPTTERDCENLVAYISSECAASKRLATRCR